MNTMLRSNGHEAGFEIMEKNTNPSDTCSWGNGIVTRAGGKGTEEEKIAHITILPWI